MPARSFVRGHVVVWNESLASWLWEDNLQAITEIRPCARCGRFPTKDGHDACLGKLKKTVAACCGHGKIDGYRIKKE